MSEADRIAAISARADALFVRVSKSVGPKRPRIPGDGDGDGIAYEGRKKPGAANGPAKPAAPPTATKPAAPSADSKLEGVSVYDKPKSVGPSINAANVSFRSQYGSEPKATDRGNWMFDSAPGSLADHRTKGATFAINGTYSQAKQKAAQQAAAWGHNQLRIAP